MRPAPAVTVRCTGGWPWRLLRAGLAAMAAAALLAWALLHAGIAPTAAAGTALLGAVLAACALWRNLHGPAARLRWDGREWSVDEQPGPIQPMMDLGRLMLLRHRPTAGRSRWLAVTAGEAGAHWHALRSALYARGAGGLGAPARQQPASD